LDPDAVWDGDRGRSRDGCVTWGGDRRRGTGSFGGELGHPIVTNGYFAGTLRRGSSQITLDRTCLTMVHRPSSFNE